MSNINIKTIVGNKGSKIDPDVDINIFIGSQSAPIRKFFGVTLQDAFDKTSRNSLNEFWWNTDSGKDLVNNWPTTFSMRFTGGTNTWANSNDPAYKGHGRLKNYENKALGPGNIIVPSNLEDFDKKFFNTLNSDASEIDNFFTFFKEVKNSSPNVSNEHSVVISYHQDWISGAYSTLELKRYLSTGLFDMVEMGNEMNAGGTRGVFYTPQDFVSGGYGWDGVAATAGQGNYVLQNRAFAITRSTQVKDYNSSIKVAFTAPPPEWFHYEKKGITLTPSLTYNKEHVRVVAAAVKNKTVKFDSWIHHSYNIAPSFINRNGKSFPNIVEAYLPKIDVSCAGSTCYNLFYQGLESDYFEYLLNAYIKPYDEIFEVAGIAEKPFHTFTEYSSSNEGEGMSDTLYAGANAIKFICAYSKLNAYLENRLLSTYYQKWTGRLNSPSLGGITEVDREYSQGLICVAQPGNIYGLTPGVDYQPTITYEAFRLFQNIATNGEFVESEKFIIKNKESNVTKDKVTVEIFRDGDLYEIIYVNPTNSDLTINFKGEVTYWTGSSTGIGSTALGNIWASGTYTSGIANYPLVSKTIVAESNILKANSFGRISQIVPTK